MVDSTVDGMYFIRSAGEANILHEVSSVAGQLKVLEDSRYRWIQSGNVSIQSAMKLSTNWQPVLPYYPGFLSVLFFRQAPENVFLIGLGGGEFVRYCNHYLPQTALTTLEKNQDMINVFRSYFNPDNLQPIIINEDVCNWRAEGSELFDIIFLDVYSDDGLPDCLYEEDLYVRLKNQLTVDGVMAANLAVKDEQEAVLLLTIIRKVFNQQIFFYSVEGHNNLIVLAFKNELPEPDKWLSEISACNMSDKFGFDFDDIIHSLFKNNKKIT